MHSNASLEILILSPSHSEVSYSMWNTRDKRTDCPIVLYANLKDASKSAALPPFWQIGQFSASHPHTLIYSSAVLC